MFHNRINCTRFFNRKYYFNTFTYKKKKLRKMRLIRQRIFLYIYRTTYYLTFFLMYHTLSINFIITLTQPRFTFVALFKSNNFRQFSVVLRELLLYFSVFFCLCTKKQTVLISLSLFLKFEVKRSEARVWLLFAIGCFGKEKKLARAIYWKYLRDGIKIP